MRWRSALAFSSSACQITDLSHHFFVAFSETITAPLPSAVITHDSPLRCEVKDRGQAVVEAAVTEEVR